MILIVLSQNFNKVSPPFSRERIHDLFGRWSHVILCIGFLSALKYLFLSSSSCLSGSCGAASPTPTTIDIRAYKLFSNGTMASEAQMEP